MKRVARAALAVLAVGCLTGCRRWAAVGDSITYNAAGQLHSQLGAGVVDGFPGRGPYPDQALSDALPAIRQLVPDIVLDGHLIVQDDGTNHTYETYGAFVDEVESIVRDDVCIVWVEPFTAADRARDLEIARAIRDQRSQLSEVVPWGDIVAAVGHERLVPDGVHPSETGNVVLVQVINHAMSWCQ